MGQTDQPDSKLFTRESYGRDEVTLVTLSPNGPVIKHLGWGSSPLADQAVPEEKLSVSERLALEALPALPTGVVNAPLTPEKAASFGPGPLGLWNGKETSQMTDWEKAQFREEQRLHLYAGDKVAKIDDGKYLIIQPMPDFK